MKHEDLILVPIKVTDGTPITGDVIILIDGQINNAWYNKKDGCYYGPTWEEVKPSHFFVQQNSVVVIPKAEFNSFIEVINRV